MRPSFCMLLVTTSLAAESNTIPPNEDVGPCICDLTAASCDPYCCCDTDCNPTLVDLWNAAKPENNLCVPEKLTTWGQQYCVKEGGEYVENGVKGTTIVRDSINTLLCVEIDNSPDLGRFYDILNENDVSEDTVAAIESQTVDYVDTMTATKDYSPGANFTTGDFIISYVNQVVQPGYRWSIPSPDVFGQCTDTNPVRWLTNQDLTSCSRSNKNCNGPLDPASYTTALTLGASPQLLTSKTPIQVQFRNVQEVKSSGLLQTVINPVVDSKGSILLEAHFTIVTDTALQSIVSAYVDIVTSSTTSCFDVQQKFSLQFVTAEGTSPRSGNPGYIAGKPLLFKFASGTSISTVQLGGAESNGSCTTFPTTTTVVAEYLMRSAPTVAFRTETVFTCYSDLTFTTLQKFCASDTSNSQSVIFRNLPQYVAKFGNPDFANIDDFVVLTAPTAVNNRWSDATGECILQNTMVLEFVTAEVGSVSNPQPKIVFARAYFQENTTWRFKQRDKSMSQRFFNTVVVTFVRYDEDTDPYKPLSPSATDAMPDDVIYPWRANAGGEVALAIWTLIATFG